MSQSDLPHSPVPVTSQPFGRYRPRWSEADARDKLLEIGQQMVASGGLTVGLDHLRFEDVIKQADVPRSTAYRIWSNKDEFYTDLLCLLAGKSWSGNAAFDAETMQVAQAEVARHADSLGTWQGRRAAVLSACRVGAERNFAWLCSSPEWRTYVALNATAMSMPEGVLRDRLMTALQVAADGFIEAMTTFYQQMCSALGFRLRPEFGTDFAPMAALGAAVVEGLGLRSLVDAELVDRRFPDSKYTAKGGGNDWSLVSLGFTAVLDAMLELEEPTDPQ